MNKRHIFPLLFGILFFSTLLFGKAPEEVTLQLRWLHQFQFAGYYMAEHQGYYRDAGLKVRILEVNDAHPNPVEEVLSSRAQYGIGNSGLVNERQNGKPVVVLAALFQSSPNIWIMRKDSGINTLTDLTNKRLMMTKNIENAELMMLFQNAEINITKLNIIETSFNIHDLIDKKVDAYNGYSTNEPYTLQKEGIEYTTIDPRQYGIDFYSDCLFTSDEELTNHPKRVKAFRDASLRGWAYALANPEETIDVILRDYSKAKTREHLRFEAEAIRYLINPDLIEIGHMNLQRWEKIAITYTKLGFSSSSKVPKGFIYDPNQTNKQNTKTLYYLLFTSLALLAVVGGVTLYIYKLNCTIKEQSIRDPLTGVYNRRYLDETFPRELARAQRELSELSIAMIDLDNFKLINDTYGHTAGDQVLKNIATCIIRSIRHNDFVSRFGGEEFIIVMPGMPTQQAYERIELCRQEIEKIVTHYNDKEITITISGGIASCVTYRETQDELVKKADDALYKSKAAGRNCITLATKN